MTREEAKNWLNKLYARSDITDEYGDMEDMQPYEEAVNMAIKALEQEPVLDKIRAEIERQDFSHHDGSNHWYMTPPEVVNIVVGIIDKYKAEFEPQESEG